MLTMFILFASCITIQICFWLFFTYHLLNKKTEAVSSEKPSVSIVICAKNEEGTIKKCLLSILSQSYPNFEIIVANDYSHDHTPIIIKELKKAYSQVLKSFIPSKDLSGKKLAIQEAVNLAQGKWIIVTDADCFVTSNQWIQKIMAKANSKIDLILGYGAYEEQSSLVNRVLRYETFYIALQYFSASLSGNTFMGVGRNMAFRKSAFLEAKPFQEHPFGPGDDDAIVQALSTVGNTAVCYSEGSCTFSSLDKGFDWASYFQKKKRHLSPFSRYNLKTKSYLFLLGFTHVGVFVFGAIAIIWNWKWVMALFILRWLTMMSCTSVLRLMLDKRVSLIQLPLLDVGLAMFYIAQMIFLPIKKKDW